MTFDIPFVVVTGFPGAGKTSAAALLADWHRVAWIRRYNTRPLRAAEVDGTDNIRITDEKYLCLLKAGKIFHPTQTVNQDCSIYYRGFPPVEEWLLSEDNTKGMQIEMMLMVTGPRAALEIKEIFPSAIVVFLTASETLLMERITHRFGNDFVSGHIDRIREYQMLNLEAKFENIIETDHLNAYDVARRIQVLMGINPITLELRRI